VGLSLSDNSTTTAKPTTPTTTQVPTTSSSTAAPSTTSTSKPSPAPPAPHVEDKPFPENIGSWNVTDATSNVTCIKFNAAIQLSLTYETVPDVKANKTKETKVGKVDVPESAVASGQCGKESQVLTLTWNNKDNKTNRVDLTFTLFEDKNKTSSGNFSLTSIALTIDKSDNASFPNATNPEVPFNESISEMKNVFGTPLNNSYRCNGDFAVKQENATVVVDFQNSQVEAFRSNPSSSTEFSKEYICTEDQVASQSFWMTFFVATFVVLILAAAIAALVMFVIRKRRSRVGSGYENM